MTLIKIIGVVAFFSLLSLAGKWDAETAEMSERDYCARVLDKVHSHYEKNINCNK